MTHIVIRTDASIEIGTGHVMRCMTLAGALRDEGVEIFFICREHDGHLCELIEKSGFFVSRLSVSKVELWGKNHPIHASWLGASWQEDANQTRAAIESLGIRPNWLVVDHYALDMQWEKYFRPLAEHIMVIDDLADRGHDCDLLLDQNYFPSLETRYDVLVPSGCQKLLGPFYTLLRREFSDARKIFQSRDGVVRRILICFGGTDVANHTPQAIRAVQALNLPFIEVEVVTSASNYHQEEVKKLCEADSRFHFHCQVSNMGELMAKTDLAISAGGFTSYELAFMGLPSLLLPVTAVQAAVSAEIGSQGAAVNLGLVDEFPYTVLIMELTKLINSPLRCREMGKIGQILFDGHGAQRVAHFLQ